MPSPPLPLLPLTPPPYTLHLLCTSEPRTSARLHSFIHVVVGPSQPTYLLSPLLTCPGSSLPTYYPLLPRCVSHQPTTDHHHPFHSTLLQLHSSLNHPPSLPPSLSTTATHYRCSSTRPPTTLGRKEEDTLSRHTRGHRHHISSFDDDDPPTTYLSTLYVQTTPSLILLFIYISKYIYTLKRTHARTVS
jgi:hypothetical protein